MRQENVSILDRDEKQKQTTATQLEKYHKRKETEKKSNLFQ